MWIWIATTSHYNYCVDLTMLGVLVPVFLLKLVSFMLELSQLLLYLCSCQINPSVDIFLSILEVSYYLFCSFNPVIKLKRPQVAPFLITDILLTDSLFSSLIQFII